MKNETVEIFNGGVNQTASTEEKKTFKRMRAADIEFLTARGIDLQLKLEKQMFANAKKHDNEYLECDEPIDVKCKVHDGFKAGSIVYEENIFDFGKYKPVLLIGFTKPLGVDNPFSDAKARTGKFRRFLVMSLYKGKISIYSQPPKGYSRVPKTEEAPLCVYCKRKPQNKCNHGACNKPRCILQAMRDNM